MDEKAVDVGARLQQAREQKKLTLRDISNATKIPVTLLAAIEHDDFAHLPAGMVRRAYVRAFATEVGVDGEALVRAYRSQFESDMLPVPSVPSRPVYEEPPASLGRFVAMLAGASVLIAAVVVFNPLRFLGTRAAPTPVHEPAQADPVSAAPPASAQPMPQVVPTANADSHVAPLRLEIRLSQRSWVSVSADGKRVIYRIMESGETGVVDAQEGITMRVGDAGAVTYSINGINGRPLGGLGEVVTVNVTTENFRSFVVDGPAPPSPL